MRSTSWMRCLGVAGLIFGALALSPPWARGAWQANGVAVAPAANVSQGIPNICPDGAQGAYIVWRHRTSADRGGDAYLQRLNAAGDVPAGWPLTGLPLDTGPHYSHFASNLAPDLFGGVYVIWLTQQFSLPDQYRMKRVLSNGSTAPGWPSNGLVLPAGSLPYGAFDGLCGDGLGGVYVVWTSADFRVLMLRYTGDGQVAPGWSAAPRPIVTQVSLQGQAHLVPAADGGFLASWADSRDGRGVGATLYALKITPSGDPDPAWPAGGVRANSIPTAQENTFTVSDGAGGLYLGWDDNRNGVFPPRPLDYEIYGQHVLANGTVDPRWPADGLPIVIAPSAQYFFEMAEDGAGGVIFVWDDYRNGARIYAVRIRPDGSVAPGWTPYGAPVAPRPAFQALPQAVADGAGGVYAFWDQDESYSEIIGQHLDPNGAPAPGWLVTGRVIAGGGDGGFYSPVGTSDEIGGAIIAYERRTSTSEYIYAQHVLADGPVPTRIAFLDSEVEPGRVRLRWSASDAGATRATVERRQDGTTWSAIGSPTSRSDALLEFEDRGLAAGRYAYRLGVDEQGAMSFTEETWVDVPAEFKLALAGFQPNPATGPGATIGFTLPDDRPASLTVHDVRGRVLIAKDLSGLGPGRHQLDLAREARLSPGVYWILLSQGGEVRRARGVVLR